MMKVLPDQTGPMAGWPEVEAMPGATRVLRALRGRYRLAVLTTGGESSEEQVRQALRRVDLDRYFERLILSRNLGLAKSDPEFYRAALSILGCRPAAAVMVGDSLENDVVAARQAGLRAVWYVPRPESGGEAAGARAAPARGRPEPDATIRDLAELPGILDRWENE